MKTNLTIPNPTSPQRLRPVSKKSGKPNHAYLVLLTAILAFTFAVQRYSPTNRLSSGGREPSVLNVLKPLSSQETVSLLNYSQRLVPDGPCGQCLHWNAYTLDSPRSTDSRAHIVVEGRDETGRYLYRLYLNPTTKSLEKMCHFVCINTPGERQHLSQSDLEARELAYLRQVSEETESGWKREAYTVNDAAKVLYGPRTVVHMWRSNLRTAIVLSDIRWGCLKTVRFKANTETRSTQLPPRISKIV